MLEATAVLLTIAVAAKGAAGSTVAATFAISSVPAAVTALIMRLLGGREVTSIRCDATSIAISGTWGLDQVSPVSDLRKVTIIHIMDYWNQTVPIATQVSVHVRTGPKDRVRVWTGGRGSYAPELRTAVEEVLDGVDIEEHHYVDQSPG